MSSSERLRLDGVRVDWSGEPILRGVDLTLRAGEFFVLLGPNGSGKTTLLRTIAGFDRPAAGRVWLDGTDVTGLPAHRRGIGYLAQEPVLLPSRSIWENVAYGPYLHRWPPGQVRSRVDDLLARLGLRHLAARRPEQISGGERQRAALARALALRPPLLMLDEPFAAIDPAFRTELRAEFRRVLTEEGTTVLHVTHDREEGLFLGDRVGLLLAGRLARVASPPEVYRDPRTVEAARFLGYNIVGPEPERVGVLPWDLVVVEAGSGRLDAVVRSRGLVGREEAIYLEGPGGVPLELRRSADGPLPPPSIGETVGLDWKRSASLPGASVPSEGDRTPAGADLPRANVGGRGSS